MTDLMERLSRAGQRIEAGWTEADVARTAPRLAQARRRRLARRLGAAAMGAGLLVVGVARLARHDAGPAGEVHLADGSRATPLDAHTELRLLHEDPASVVMELQRGRGRFEVTRGPQRVFQVHAGEVNVRVLGTVFTVERVADRVGVTVDRGRVRVQWPGGEKDLTPGESGWFPPLMTAPAPALSAALAPSAAAPQGSFALSATVRGGGEGKGEVAPLIPRMHAKPPTTRRPRRAENERSGEPPAIAGRTGISGGASATSPLPSPPPRTAAERANDETGATSSGSPRSAAANDETGATSSGSPRSAAAAHDETGATSSGSPRSAAAAHDQTGATSSASRRPAAAAHDQTGATSSASRRPAAAAHDQTGATSSASRRPAVAANDEIGATPSASRRAAVGDPRGDGVNGLLEAADEARLVGERGRAVRLLETLLAEHPGDRRAQLAAFTLGKVLLEERGRAGDAALAFARARALAPAGPLAEDALAREAEAWTRAEAPGRARAAAAEYLRLYPAGHRRAAVEALAGSDR